MKRNVYRSYIHYFGSNISNESYFLEECVLTCFKLLVSNNKVSLRFTESWIQHRTDSNYGKYFTSNLVVTYCILMDNIEATYRHMWEFYTTFQWFSQRSDIDIDIVTSYYHIVAQHYLLTHWFWNSSLLARSCYFIPVPSTWQKIAFLLYTFMTSAPFLRRLK